MIIIQTLYIIAGIIAIGAGIPQLLKLIAIKDSQELSIGTWLLWLCTQSVTAAYFLTLGDVLAIAVSFAWVAFYACMVALIVHYHPKKTAVIKELIRLRRSRPLADTVTSAKTE